MFYLFWLLAIVSDVVMVYAVNHMVRHSFWQVITFDSALLVGVVCTGFVCFYAYKGLRKPAAIPGDL